MCHDSDDIRCAGPVLTPLLADSCTCCGHGLFLATRVRGSAARSVGERWDGFIEPAPTTAGGRLAIHLPSASQPGKGLPPMIMVSEGISWNLSEGMLLLRRWASLGEWMCRKGMPIPLIHLPGVAAAIGELRPLPATVAVVVRVALSDRVPCCSGNATVEDPILSYNQWQSEYGHRAWRDAFR